MLHIGEFSALTGLTVKALRQYDEQGLLAPARIDDASGRRFYAPRQIRDALAILTMREADIPLPVIARALGSPDGVDALEQQRERELRERRRHDAAFDLVRQTFAAAPVEVVVARREMPRQAFLALPLAADPRVNASEQDDASDLFARAGVDLGDTHWVSTRVREHETHDVALCWPVADAAEPHDGADFVAGVLPARTEIFVGRRTDAAGLQDLGWYAEALTSLVEASAHEDRAHRDGFWMRYQVDPIAPDAWNVDLSLVV